MVETEGAGEFGSLPYKENIIAAKGILKKNMA